MAPATLWNGKFFCDPLRWSAPSTATPAAWQSKIRVAAVDQVAELTHTHRDANFIWLNTHNSKTRAGDNTIALKPNPIAQQTSVHTLDLQTSNRSGESMSNKPTSTGAEATANFLGDSFLRIAKYFREIQDYAPEQFAEVAKLVGVSLRRAYYFAKIDRTFSSLGVDENRLCFIGWSKLKVIADRIDSSNYEQLLELAETSTVRELRILMRDGVPVAGTRCVILYLEPMDYELFEKAIVAFGGTKAGRGLVDKEAALIKALAKSLDA